MRRDSSYVADLLARRLNSQEAYSALRTLYDRLVDSLASILLAAFAYKYSSPAIDLPDADEVQERRLQLQGEAVGLVITMDPLVSGPALPLAVSRVYEFGGLRSRGFAPRPGSPPLAEQLGAIAQSAGDHELVIIEDDVFTGGTLLWVLDQCLGALKSKVSAVIVGLQVAPAPADVRVVAAVQYVLEGGCMAEIDIGAPRDYVVGLGGLVCSLPSGRIGRLPFSLPYVSLAARASVPHGVERDLSAAVLQLSEDFYTDVQDLLRRPIPLSALEQSFAAACGELFGLGARASIVDAIRAVRRNL